MRWAQPILRLSRRACARANDGLASVNAGQPLMKNLSHFVKSVLYMLHDVSRTKTIYIYIIYQKIQIHESSAKANQSRSYDDFGSCDIRNGFIKTIKAALIGLTKIYFSFI